MNRNESQPRCRESGQEGSEREECQVIKHHSIAERAIGGSSDYSSQLQCHDIILTLRMGQDGGLTS